MYNVHLLPAGFGDSILIEYGKDEPNYILIDSGPYHEFKDVMDGIKLVAPNLTEIELLVVTHVDIDHIDGIVVMLNQPTLPFKIKQVWFNGRNELQKVDDTLGSLQGEYLGLLIDRLNIPHNKPFANQICVVTDPDNPPLVKLKGGMEIRLLNPGVEALKKLIPVWDEELEKFGADVDFASRLEDDHRYDEVDDILGDLTIEQMQEMVIKGDDSEANGSSIAFLGTYEGKTCLFAGDAFTDYLLPAIDVMLQESGEDRLRLDAWKLAHHGSKKSTLDALMEKIDCQHILISSDGKRYKHPDKACIAKLLKYNGPDLNLYFNFSTTFTTFWDDVDLKDEYSYTPHYPDAGTSGISINL